MLLALKSMLPRRDSERDDDEARMNEMPTLAVEKDASAEPPLLPRVRRRAATLLPRHYYYAPLF